MNRFFNLMHKRLELQSKPLFYTDLRPYSKSKLELESNLAKFCRLVASLSVVLPQLNLTKLKHKYLKFGF